MQWASSTATRVIPGGTKPGMDMWTRQTEQHPKSQNKHHILLHCRLSCEGTNLLISLFPGCFLLHQLPKPVLTTVCSVKRLKSSPEPSPPPRRDPASFSKLQTSDVSLSTGHTLHIPLTCLSPLPRFLNNSHKAWLQMPLVLSSGL